MSDIDKLSQRYLRNKHDIKLRHKLCEYYEELLHYHIMRFVKTTPLTYEELYGAAYEGLIKAVEKFSPDRGVKFRTFCQRRISGAILDWLRNTDPNVSRSVRDFGRKGYG